MPCRGIFRIVAIEASTENNLGIQINRRIAIRPCQVSEKARQHERHLGGES